MPNKTRVDCNKNIMIVCNELQNLLHHRGHIVKDLIGNGFGVDIYASPIGTVDKDFGFQFYPLDIHRFGFSIVNDFWLFMTVLKLLRAKPATDLYLLHLKPYLFGGLAAFLARRFGWNGKLIINVAGLGRLYEKDSFRIGKSMLRRLIIQSLLRFSSQKATVVFETENDKNVWIKHELITPDQALVTNGTGIDFSIFPERSVTSSPSLRVLFAGRLLKSKGLPVFMRAATELGRQTLPTPIEMIVAGATELDPDSVDQATLESHPGLTYLGYVADMPELLQNSDIVVLPSLYNEGVPRILLEAAATGCLMMATRFTGSEMLIQDFETGLFLNGNTCEELASDLVSKLKEISTNPQKYSHCGPNASAYIQQSSFSAAAVSKKIIDVLEAA